MRLKYYLRGLGIGIVVTALVMGIILPKNTTSVMTDDEIRSRAKELGMVMEDDVLKPVQEADVKDNGKSNEVTKEEKAKKVDNTKKSDDTKKADDAKKIQDKAKEDVEAAKKEIKQSDTKKEDTKKEDTKKEDSKKDDTKKEDSKKTDSKKIEKISVNITAGSSSEDVAALLQKAGVIDDAKAFDAFLVKGGYDKKLSSGSVEVKTGMSYEEAAKALINNK